MIGWVNRGHSHRLIVNYHMAQETGDYQLLLSTKLYEIPEKRRSPQPQRLASSRRSWTTETASLCSLGHRGYWGPPRPRGGTCEGKLGSTPYVHSTVILVNYLYFVQRGSQKSGTTSWLTFAPGWQLGGISAPQETKRGRRPLNLGESWPLGMVIWRDNSLEALEMVKRLGLETCQLFALEVPPYPGDLYKAAEDALNSLKKIFS